MTDRSTTRRRFLQLGGVSLMNAGLLRVLAAGDSRRASRARACILLFQVGGPYQCETFDPKPGAPEDIRGLYKAMASSVPGIQLTDGLPLVAQQAHRFALVRSVYHTIRCHNPAIYCSLVGREATDPMAI